MTPTNNNVKDHHYAKPPIFEGEKFDYWKDRIKSFFLGYDSYLCDMVMDSHTHYMDSNGIKLERNKMDKQHKKNNKNHYRPRTILLNVISYIGYGKITNRDSTNSKFDSLRMTHEEDEQVKKLRLWP